MTNMHIAFFSMNWNQLCWDHMAFIKNKFMFNSVWGHATSILSRYFHGHKLAFDQTRSHITYAARGWTPLHEGNTACTPLHRKWSLKWTAMFKINSSGTSCPWWESFNATYQIMIWKKRELELRYMVDELKKEPRSCVMGLLCVSWVKGPSYHCGAFTD